MVRLKGILIRNVYCSFIRPVSMHAPYGTFQCLCFTCEHIICTGLSYMDSLKELNLIIDRRELLHV